MRRYQDSMMHALIQFCLQVPHYMAAQYTGALAASGLVFLVYWDALVWYEHDR